MASVTQDKVRELFEVFNSRSASKMSDYFADDITFVDSIDPASAVRGKQAMVRNMENWFRAFPDFSYTPTSTVIHGDTAHVLYVASGTFRAPLATPDGATIPATNRRGGWTGCVVIAFTPQGKARSITDVYDAPAWLAQFGVTPP